MRSDQLHPVIVPITGARVFAFSILTQRVTPQEITSTPSLHIIQDEPTKERALAKAQAAALDGKPGFVLVDWVCCELTAAPAAAATEGRREGERG